MPKGDKNVATDLKCFTISITDELEMDLNEEKKETYYAETQSEMVRDLIARGLVALRAKKAVKEKDHKKTVIAISILVFLILAFGSSVR